MLKAFETLRPYTNFERVKIHLNECEVSDNLSKIIYPYREKSVINDGALKKRSKVRCRKLNLYNDFSLKSV